MSTLSHGPSTVVRSERWWWLGATQMWASLAICVIWLAVLFAAIFAPDIRTIEAGGNSTTVPSAVAIALFAALGTWPIARYGFHRESD